MDRDVDVRVELEGRYSDVIDVLGKDKFEYKEINPLIQDIIEIIDALEDSGRLTRQKIKENTSIEFEGPLINNLLKYMQAHNIVELDGSTWSLGPKLKK